MRQLEKQIGVRAVPAPSAESRAHAPAQLIATEAMNAFAALRASFVTAADLDQSRLSITTLPTIGTSWLTPRLGGFRARHPEIQFELELSADAHDLAAGRFDAAIRNGHGRWPGLRTVKLFPSIFMPLCTPALKHAAAALADPAARWTCHCWAEPIGGSCGIARSGVRCAVARRKSARICPRNIWTSHKR